MRPQLEQHRLGVARGDGDHAGAREVVQQLRVAVELEWNNKDPFFDRDLNNFRLLFDLRAIDVGVILTRATELQGVFDRLGKGASYGSSTTHHEKLWPRIEGGSGGGCPVLTFAITPALYVDDGDAALEAADVPASRLFDVADCANDPHFRARGAVLPVDDPLIGATLQPGPAIRLDGDPPEAAIGWTGPALGAHTRYVLDTLLAAAPPR